MSGYTVYNNNAFSLNSCLRIINTDKVLNLRTIIRIDSFSLKCVHPFPPLPPIGENGCTQANYIDVFVITEKSQYADRP